MLPTRSTPWIDIRGAADRGWSLAAVGIASIAGAAWARRRASAAVRGWSPGVPGELLEQEGLRWREFGAGDDTIVLLHGLPGTNAVWGGEFDKLGGLARVIAVDLPGFGGSKEAAAPLHDLRSVVAALDRVLTERLTRHGQTAAGGRLLLVGHSYGSRVAVEWAATRGDVDVAVLICPPFFATAVEGRERIARMTRGARWFVDETPLVHGACEALARIRPIVRTVAPIAAPHLPVPVARAGTETTWAGFHGALWSILRCDWNRPLVATAAAGTRIVVLEGELDPLTAGGPGATLVAGAPNVRYERIAGAGHELPMSHGAEVASMVIDEFRHGEESRDELTTRRASSSAASAHQV